MLRNADGQGGTVAVMRFDVVRGGGREDFRVPRRLRSPESLPPPSVDRRWNLGFGFGAWQINGRDFDPERMDIPAAPRQHRALERASTAPTACTRCTSTATFSASSSAAAGPVHAGDRLGWKDTIGVLPNKTVTVLAWFAPYSGRYVFHCHALEHADKAMMLQLQVVP